MNEEKKFRFWMPLDTIQKSVDKDGKDVLIVGGIASTKRLDFDGETLNPTKNGFDVSYLAERGVVNWNHSKAPEAVIGEPTKIEFRPEGLYVESMLYPDNPLAVEVYKLGERFKNNSKKRRLGYSIEGKAAFRDPNNPLLVSKARITGLALTVNPKNADSLVDIIKGDFHEYKDDDTDAATILDITNAANGGQVQYLIDVTRPDGVRMVVDNSYNIKIYKDLSAESSSGRAIAREHVDGELKYLTKGEVYDKIFDRYGVISLSNADLIYKSLNINTMSTTKNPAQGVTNLTEDTLEKALEVLSPDLLEKGVDTPKQEGSKEESNGDNAPGKGTTIVKGADAAEDDEEGKEKEKKPEAKEDKEADISKGINDLFKGLSDELGSVSQTMGRQFGAVGTLLKGINDKVNTMRDTIAERDEQIESLHTELGELRKGLENDTNGGRRSVTTATRERNFNNDESADLKKGIDQQEGGAQLHIQRDKKRIVGLLDEMTFGANGMDPELAKALTTFEASGVMDNNTAARIRKDRGITIVAG